MPSVAVVEAFMADVERGDHVGAIERWYAPDAFMQENQAEPRRGRDRLMADEAAALARVASVNSRRLGPPLINGDNVAIRWRFEFTTKSGELRVLDEIAWQTWRGERIQEEVFFYDPKQMAG